MVIGAIVCQAGKLSFTELHDGVFPNGKIDSNGVHIDDTPDSLVPSYIFVNGRVIPIDSYCLLIGVNQQFYSILCGASIYFIPRIYELCYEPYRAPFTDDIDPLELDDECEEYMRYFIEDDAYFYVTSRVVNSKAVNSVGDISSIVEYTNYDYDKLYPVFSYEYPTSSYEYPVFSYEDTDVLKLVLQLAKDNSADYRFIYVDENGVESYFEYKWHDDCLILYFIYILDDTNYAYCDYTWTNGIVLHLKNNHNNYERVVIKANDVSLFVVKGYKKFEVVADKVVSVHKVLNTAILDNIDEFMVAAKDIDSTLSQLKSGKQVSNVGTVIINSKK